MPVRCPPIVRPEYLGSPPMQNSLRFVIPLILATVCPLAALPGDKPLDGEEGFYRANAAYKEGRYPEAIQGYRDLIASGHAGGHLYYNLGNAYFRSGALGPAILNYERARLLIPRRIVRSRRIIGSSTADIPRSG